MAAPSSSAPPATKMANYWRGPSSRPPRQRRLSAAPWNSSGRSTPQSIGIGSFGPVDLKPDSPKFGYITATPKKRLARYGLAGTVRRATGLPVAFDTDVNAAALGEAVGALRKGWILFFI